jgi:hypothetical protein
MKRKPLISFLLLIVVGGVALFVAVEQQKAQRLAAEQQKAQRLAAEERDRAVRMLAIDDLHRECQEMQAKLKESRDLSNIGMGFQILSYEMNIRSAINRTLDKDSTSELSLRIQGPLTPETKLRVMAEAARRIEEAGKIYDAAHSMK